MAIQAKDILLDDDYDIRFLNGDLFVGASDPQHLALITITDIGHWKETPFLGAGLLRKLGGNFNPAEIKAACQSQYESDGYKVNSITITGGFVENVVAERIL